MICPYCSELGPPGPLDVRSCAPRLGTRSNPRLGLLFLFFAMAFDFADKVAIAGASS